MRVLIATPLYPPDVGGPATYSKLLVEGLPAHDIEVTMVNFGQFRHLPVGVRHILYLVRLMRDARGANVLYALDPWSTGVPAMLAALFLRKTFMVRIAGDYAWEQGVQRFGVTHQLDTFVKRSGNEYHLFVRLLRAVERMVARHAVRVVVPSEYLKRIVSSWGIPKRKIVVIHNGFQDFAVGGRKQVLRGMVKARGELMISAGRLVPWKGFDALIKVMPELAKKFPNCKLLIAGQGPDMERLEALTARLAVREKVVFLGKLPQEILYRYIKIADVFVLNTSYEGFSHQLLETMAIGTPVVTTNVGGNPEIIENEKQGILVRRNSSEALQSAIERLLRNKALRDRLARAAKRLVGDFNEEKTLRETAAFLKRIV